MLRQGHSNPNPSPNPNPNPNPNLTLTLTLTHPNQAYARDGMPARWPGVVNTAWALLALLAANCDDPRRAAAPPTLALTPALAPTLTPALTLTLTRTPTLTRTLTLTP